MTVHKMYSCDLCNDSIGERTDPSKLPPTGIYWQADNVIEFKPVKQAEHHICGNCRKALREALNKVVGQPL